jgi:hypothetical protein
MAGSACIELPTVKYHVLGVERRGEAAARPVGGR